MNFSLQHWWSDLLSSLRCYSVIVCAVEVQCGNLWAVLSWLAVGVTIFGNFDRQSIDIFCVRILWDVYFALKN